MTETTITPLPAEPFHALEIWSNPAAVAKRFQAITAFALPAMGHSASGDRMQLIRFEPTMWLVTGDIAPLPAILGDDGCLTAIGGGIVRVRLTGEGWRSLLMEAGVFDAESPRFAAGCSAATIIDHVNVRLLVVDAMTCDAFVPASYSDHLIHFWRQAAATMSAS